MGLMGQAQLAILWFIACILAWPNAADRVGDKLAY